MFVCYLRFCEKRPPPFKNKKTTTINLVKTHLRKKEAGWLAGGRVANFLCIVCARGNKQLIINFSKP